MGRTVTDIAILLGVLQSPFGEVIIAPFLQRGALHGARIGIDQRYFDYSIMAARSRYGTVARQGLDVMEQLGATIVDTDTGDPC